VNWRMKSINPDFSQPAMSVHMLEQVDLQSYWLGIKRRWKPAVGVFAATLALAGAAASTQKPSYTVSSKVLLRSDRLPGLTGLGNGNGGESGGGLGSITHLTQQSSPIRTESEMLLSNRLLERTVKALQLKDKAGQLLTPESLASGFKIKEVSGADVLKVTYTDRDPKRAAAILNQLMKEYLQSNIAENRTEAAAAHEFIAQELPKTEAVVHQADEALRAFKERSGIANLESEERLVSAGLGEIEGQITRTRTELSEANSRYGSLQDKLGMSAQQALTAGSLSQATGVQQALLQLQQLQSQLELERTRLQADHPTMINLAEKEAALKQLLSQRIGQAVGNQSVSSQSLSLGELKQGLVKEYIGSEVSQSSLAERMNALNSARSAYRSRLSLLPRLEQEQRDLQRRLEVAQSTYATLLKKLQEVQITERQTVGTARLIESATVPTEPTGSTKNLFWILGGLMGTALGLSTVLLLEARDPSLKTIKDVRNLLGYAWLGTIPFFGKPTRPLARNARRTVPLLPVRDMPRSVVSAAYRMLQANLRFISLDGALKSVVISSAVPQEGKSTIAANLAVAMAQLGRRTLLIDADLYHPSQHQIWQLPNGEGLSNLVVEQSEARHVIHSVMDNLDVLPSGLLPPNPLAILDSQRLANLVKTLSSDYDFVVIDSSPLLVEAAALSVAKLADGLVLVARPGVLDSHSAKTAKELLQQSGQRVLGLVINSAVLAGEPSPSPYYDYQDTPAPAPLPAALSRR
jgi:polysaccharide biosynthesis transport protein